MDHSRTPYYFFFVLLLMAAAAAIFLFMPFITPIILAMAGAVLSYPVYETVRKILGKGRVRDSFSALITVILVLVVILVPLFLLAGSIYSEVQMLYVSLTDEANRSEVINVLNSGWQALSNAVFGILPQHSFDTFNITDIFKSGLQWIFGNLDAIFKGITKVAGYAVIFLISLFYFLRDGDVLKKRFVSWSPLLDSNDEYITRTFKRAVRSVFAGTLAVAVIDGISVGLAFLAFGIPAPALWGTIAAVASLIPGLGMSLMIIPGAAYLYLTGNTPYAAALLCWGYATVILADHFIGPNLVNRGIRMHPLVVLLSVLGGLLTFGLVGFVLGPLILVALFTLLDIYRKSAKEKDGESKVRT